LEVGTVTVSSLAEPFTDKRRNPCRTLGQLFPHFRIPPKRRPLQHRRNCIGSFERLLMNLQIFERFDDHGSPDRMLRAGRTTTND